MKPYLPYRPYLPYQAGAGAAAAFSPGDLFAAGEQGAWCDPSDLTTMFQNRVGSTPVTANGQTVGLILDKSKGLVLGPELVTNGDFSNGTTGWTSARSSVLTVVGGGMQIANASNNFGSARQNFAVTTGAKYKISFDVVSTSSNASLWAGSTIEGTQSIDSGLLIAGSYSYIVSAAGPTMYVQVLNSQATIGLLSVFDNISIKEIAGNHATAPSDAARPLYKVTGASKWNDFDAIDDNLGVTFPASLGAQCTVARSVVGGSPVFLTAQSIGTSYNINVDNAGWLVIDRALTTQETTDLTAWLLAKGAT